jgi:Ca2+/Na+ antiporter
MDTRISISIVVIITLFSLFIIFFIYFIIYDCKAEKKRNREIQEERTIIQEEIDLRTLVDRRTSDLETLPKYKVTELPPYIISV